MLALLAILGTTGAVPWEAPRDGLQPVPALQARVTDLTGTLSAAERQGLEAKLADWEARTTNQLAILIVPTTQPEPIEAYSIRVVEAWKLGQKGKDNGALLLIAKGDKQIRIEVGYGLEGVLTDITSHRIITETIAPLFSKGQFAAGLNAGVDRIISVVGEGKPLPAAEPRQRQSTHFDLGTLALILLVAVPAVGAILRSILGNVGGSVAGAGIVGAAAWFFAGSVLVAIILAIISFVVIGFSVFGGRGGPGMWIPGGGGGFGGGGGGGGFSGGGGGFGGGGASGGW